MINFASPVPILAHMNAHQRRRSLVKASDLMLGLARRLSAFAERQSELDAPKSPWPRRPRLADFLPVVHRLAEAPRFAEALRPGQTPIEPEGVG